MKPERIKQITIDVLSFKERDVVYIRCLGEMHRSDRVDKKDDGRESATVMRVVNLEDGLEYRLVCPSLMVSAFEDESINYVGKCFEVTVSSRPVPGKRYKSVEVYEIADPGDELITLRTTLGEANEKAKSGGK